MFKNNHRQVTMYVPTNQYYKLQEHSNFFHNYLAFFMHYTNTYVKSTIQDISSDNNVLLEFADQLFKVHQEFINLI